MRQAEMFRLLFVLLVTLALLKRVRYTINASWCGEAGMLTASDVSNNVSRMGLFPSAGAKLVFLKTHKTGSSSVSGILWRQLCETRKRHCFLPPADHPGRTWNLDSPDDRAYVSSSSGGTFGSGPPFDVWVHHLRRADSLANVYMNRSPAVADGPSGRIQFVSIVRNPSDRFRSAWSWYRHGNETFAGVGGLSLERFAELMCHERCNSWKGPSISELSALGPFASPYNRMAAWVARRYAATAFKHRTGLDATAEELVGLRTSDQAFSAQFAQLLSDVAEGRVLLLVCERFEESLLVLGRLFLQTSGVGTGTGEAAPGFPFPGLLYLRQKQQKSLEPLSATLRTQLEELQPHDSALHVAANLALDRWLQGLFPDRARLQTELRLLRAQTEAVAAACGGGGVEAQVPADRLPDLDEGQVAALCAYLARDNRQLVEDAWRELQLSGAKLTG